MNALQRTLRAIGLLAVAAPTIVGAGLAQSLPGNLFSQNGAPLGSNVSIAVNNPQNMGGGGWVGGDTSNYPIGGSSPILDGNSSTVWNAGVFSGGGMCNVGITQGAYTDASGNSFTNVPFAAIDTIRISAQNYLNSPPDNWFIKFPQQVEIAYTTSSFSPGNGFTYNSGTLGVLPGTWDNVATITAVNGAAPTSATSNDPAYGTGWVNLNGAFTQGMTVINANSAGAYVDLTVAIPAGATSIMISFGEDNSSTGNPGGIAIADISATLHPTWSNAQATGIWDSTTANFVSAAGATVTYSDGLPVTFDDGGGGGTVTIQGSGSPAQVRPYSVTFANNATNYTLAGDPIGGSASLSLTGSGTVTLASANTFTGTTSVTNPSGTLILAHTNALQGSTLTTGAGQVVFDQSVAGHIFNVGGLSGSVNLVLQDNAVAPNPITLSVGGNNQSTVYSGVLSGSGSLVKTGSGVLTLGASSSYTGPTVVAQGTLQLSPGEPTFRYYEFAPTAINGATSGHLVQLSEFAFYNSTGSRVYANSVSNPGGFYASGEGPASLNDNNLGTKWCEQTTNLSAMQVYFDMGSPTAIAGYNLATANDSIGSREPSSWQVLGSNDGVNFTAIDTQSNVPTPGSTFTWYNGGSATPFAIASGPANSLPTTTALSIAAGATFDLNGNVQQVASLGDGAGGGGTVTNSSGAPATLTLAPTDGGSTAFSGTIQDGAGGVSLIVSGNGTAVLTGINTLSGTTRVTGGALNLSNSNALQNSTLVPAGGNIVFDQSVAGHAFTVGGLSGSGSLALQDNAASPNPVALTVGGNNSNTTYSGSLSGAGSLIKTGSGTLSLSGANGHGGGTMINQGTLAAIQRNSGNPLGTGPVTLAGGTLRLVGNGGGGQQTVGASGWNIDGIAENTAASPAAGTNSTGTNFSSFGWAWYEQGAPNAPQGQGLPSGGVVTSQSGSHLQFQLQPYAGANNILFTNGTLTLNNPARFQTLQFLQSGQGGGNYTATLNFADGSTDTLNSPYLDWTSGATAQNPFALTNVGLAGLGQPWGGNYYQNQLSLFENDFTLSPSDQTKTLNSITFNTSGGGGLMLFALSGDILAPTSPSYGNAVNVAADSTIDLQGIVNATLGGLNIGSNTLSVTGDAGASLTVGVTTLSGNPTFEPAAGIALTLGALSDGGTPRMITLSGAGTVQLTAAATSLATNTIVNVNAGALNIGAPAALGATAQVNVGASGTFNVGANQTISALGGAGAVVVGSGSTLTVGSSDNLSSVSFTGTIGGAGALATGGTGTLTLNSANSYGGGTTVNSGTLQTTVDGALGAGPLALNAAAGVTSAVNLGGNETVSGLSVNVASTGQSTVTVQSGKTLTVPSTAATSVQGTLRVAGGGTVSISSSLLTLADGSALNLQGGTFVINAGAGASGSIGTGVTAIVATSATLELANTVPVPVAVANRVMVTNDGTLAIGDGTTPVAAVQQVGGIDGTGSVVVNDTASLTADHIKQTSLVIGSGATFTLAPSNTDGNPMVEQGLALAGSLTPSSSFLASSTNFLGVGSASSAPAVALGAGLGGATATAVPEPSTILLALIAGIAALPMLQRNRR